ncbi:MAG TPA: HEAT repeat domain-containing protein [Polyangiales bacterium]|nr:HEAT repeat domain-containing protein [Polyangiales bacterium]
MLPLRQARTLRTESFTLATGHSVGVVRASDGSREAAALVVRKPNGDVEIIWTGALFLSGDPGERRADAIEVADRDGDKHPDLIVGTYDERVRVCGQERALLSPRALDPKTLTLRSVLLNRLDPKRPVQKTTASAQGPGTQGPPVLRALHPVSASSAAQGAAGADIRAVVDGDLSTFWSEGRGLGGRFEFLSLRWAAPDKPITALALVVPAAASGAQPFAVARKISISTDQGPRLEVSLPQGVAPGQRYWIVPQTPLRSSCLTVSLDDVAQSGPQVHAAIAELEAYTDLDQGGGVQALLDEVIKDGPHAADATELLMHTSADVVPQLSAALPSLSPTARRRALRVLSARAGTDDRALELIAVASRDTDPEVARAALTTLVQQLPRSQNLLLTAAAVAGRAGDEAALALARSGGASSLRGLLDLLASDARAPERTALRDAVGLAFRHGGAEAPAVVDAWRQQPTLTLQARAAASLGLAAVAEAKPAAAKLLADSLGIVGEFPERWRLVRAAAQLPSEPKTDAWLAGVVTTADEWMLRSAALEALEARRTPAALPAAKSALTDSYPRVRARALHVLSSDHDSIAVLAQYARKDEWFLVRAAALTALPDAAAARSAMLESLADSSPVVRAAAIHALRRVHAADAWPKIEPLVANTEEYPDVIEAGVAFARALCLDRAAPTLQEVVKRGLRPEAWTADQELAQSALEALTHLGGEHAKWAVQRMAAPIVPPSVRAAAERAAAQPQRCVVE